jgi:hypothetical protein
MHMKPRRWITILTLLVAGCPTTNEALPDASTSDAAAHDATRGDDAGPYLGDQAAR